MSAVPPQPPPSLRDVARSLGLHGDRLQPRGGGVAKLLPPAGEPCEGAPGRRRSRNIVVTGVTPVDDPVGKTVVAIALTEALWRLGRRAVCVQPQPSIGTAIGPRRRRPGGGRCQLAAGDELGMHLTGDFQAVAAAHNLVAGVLGQCGSALGLRPAWPRVSEPFEAALTGQGFVPIGDSELMAILALASNGLELRRAVGAVEVGAGRGGRPATLDSLGLGGAVAAVLRAAMAPTVVATTGGAPVLLHSGSSADLCHGGASVLAEVVAAEHAELVVSEAAHGADLGAERLFNLRARLGGPRPDAVVLVATLAAVRGHGGGELAGGLDHLAHQIEVVRLHGVAPVVVVNLWPDDSAAAAAELCRQARAAGARAALTSQAFESGASASLELAECVAAAAAEQSSFRHLYRSDAGLADKIELVATRVYGADGVDYSDAAAAQVAELQARGHGTLPICIAKTERSISHDPARPGRPVAFRLPVTGAALRAGAGYVVVETGGRARASGAGWEHGWTGGGEGSR